MTTLIQKLIKTTSMHEGLRQECFDDILKLMSAVRTDKQSDYGHAYISLNGWQGVLHHIEGKLFRVNALLLSGDKPKNESLFDNMLDIAIYAAIGCSMLQSEMESREVIDAK